MSQPGEGQPNPPSKRRGYWIPGLIALAALLAIGTALGAGDLNHSSPHTLHGPDIASQISLGMQAQQGGHSPPPVTCPSSEPVRQGLEFTCTVQVHGLPAAVKVVEIDSRGTLRWQIAN